MHFTTFNLFVNTWTLIYEFTVIKLLHFSVGEFLMGFLDVAFLPSVLVFISHVLKIVVRVKAT